MSNALLQKAISEFEKLPVEEQNAVAARWLEELKDEQIWADKFAATADEQWDRLAGSVRKDIAKGNTESLRAFLDEMPAE